MITISDLSISAGAFALRNISFEVAAGQYVALMGRTGSGKTSIIESICGLRRIDGGTILLRGRDVTALRPSERGIGYMPQDGALFSTMTVREHLAFALMLRRRPKPEIHARVQQLAERLGIAYLLGRRPQGLSGGEAQRVALGRALSAQPHFLCLDEPLNALDRNTHQAMCTLLKTISRETGMTTLHVTHSIAEAHAVADRVLVVEDGRVVDGKLE